MTDKELLRRLRRGDESAVEAAIDRYGLVQDGRMLEEVSLRGEELCHSFTLPSDGGYCFTLSYYSASADNFTEGKIVIE